MSQNKMSQIILTVDGIECYNSNRPNNNASTNNNNTITESKVERVKDVIQDNEYYYNTERIDENTDEAIYEKSKLNSVNTEYSQNNGMVFETKTEYKLENGNTVQGLYKLRTGGREEKHKEEVANKFEYRP